MIFLRHRSSKMRAISLITLCSMTSLALASYCGQSAIPFSFEALANGQPILGCARPSCFGWNADGKRSADAAQFYKIGKQSDGFLRTTDTHGPVVKNATYFRPQFSICDRSYMSEQCAVNQWVGGISPLPKVIPGSGFRVMCCSYTKLMESSDQGVAEIRGGETVVGGEIHGEDGRQHSFEYISNIQRSFNQKGEVVYSVTMKRFPCLPEPELTETNVESGTAEILIKNVEKVQKPDIQFAAPTLQIQPLPQQQQPAQTFNNMRFDIPNSVPAEDSRQQQYYQQQGPQQQYFQQGPQQQQQQQLNPLQQATAEPTTETPPSSGCRKLANGQSAPCAKVYEDEPQQQQQQQQPIAIPQTSESQQQPTVYGPQQQQQATVPSTKVQQQRQPQYYQSSVYDPLGLFRQNYAAPAYPQQQQQQPQHQMFGHQHSAVQAIPQPNHSYNPYWPFQGYYDYTQNPSAAYGVQTAQASQGFQPHPLFAAHVTKTAVPRPQPLPVPTIEEVEKAIPPAGRRMIYNVARTLLNLY